MNPGDHALTRCTIIKGQHRNTAGHGFECYIAKGFGEARKKQQVRRSIVGRQILARSPPSKHGVGRLALQPSPGRTIAHHDQAGIRLDRADLSIRRDQEVEILLRSNAADGHHHQCGWARSPGGSQFLRTSGGMKAAGIHTTGHHLQALKAGSF